MLRKDYNLNPPGRSPWRWAVLLLRFQLVLPQQGDNLQVFLCCAANTAKSSSADADNQTVWRLRETEGRQADIPLTVVSRGLQSEHYKLGLGEAVPF